MSFVVVGEVDKEVFSGHQLHDGVSQELHPLVVAAGKEAEVEYESRKWKQADKAQPQTQTNATNFQESGDLAG